MDSGGDGDTVRAREVTAKAIRVHAFGGNDALTLDEVAEPTAGEGEYVVRIRAADAHAASESQHTRGKIVITAG